MLDKTILVFYINVANVGPSDRREYVDSVMANIANSTSKEDSEKMIRYFLPIEGESRIECLNPPTCINNDEVYSKLLKQVADIDKTLDKVTSRMSPLTRKILLEKTI